MFLNYTLPHASGQTKHAGQSFRKRNNNQGNSWLIKGITHCVFLNQIMGGGCCINFLKRCIYPIRGLHHPKNRTIDFPGTAIQNMSIRSRPLQHHSHKGETELESEYNLTIRYSMAFRQLSLSVKFTLEKTTAI